MNHFFSARYIYLVTAHSFLISSTPALKVSVHGGGGADYTEMPIPIIILWAFYSSSVGYDMKKVHAP